MLFKSKLLTLSLSLSFISFIILSAQCVYAVDYPEIDIFKSPIASIYDNTTGEYISGPTLPSEDYVVRLVYQGDNITKDTTVDGKVYSITGGNQPGQGVSVQTNSIVRVHNVGTLKGIPLVIAIQPKVFSNLTVGYNSKNTSSLLLFNNQKALDYTYNIWIEDINGNIIDDKDAFFIFSISSEYANTDFNYVGYNFISNTKNPVLLAPNNLKTLAPQTTITHGRTDLSNNYTNTLLKEVKAHPASALPFTYGFKQFDGSSLSLTQSGTYLGKVGLLNSLMLFDKKDMAGVKIPFQPPTLLETKNEIITGNNAMKAQLKVVQHSSAQMFDTHIPQNLDITIDLGDYINLKNISKELFTITDSNSNNVTNNASFIMPSDSSDGKLHVLFSRAFLFSKGDQDFTIEAMLPLNTEHPDIYKNLVSGENNSKYIKLTDLTAKNNEHATLSLANLYIKVPGPSGEPIKDIAVFQYSKASNLTPVNLVTNLTSHIPGDTVKVLYIYETDKIFNTLGEDYVNVLIQSTITGIFTWIKVPIMVFSNSINILEPMKIIPEPNQVIANKSDFIFKPNYKQVIIQPTESISNIDSVRLTIGYANHLEVEKNHFTLATEKGTIPSSNYTVAHDPNKKNVIFTFNNTAINSYLGQTITIKQNSNIIKDDANIMDYYDSAIKSFVFPITAYHSFGSIGATQRFTQDPITKETQVIKYQPVNDAKAIPEETVELNSLVKKPSEYLTNISDKDFDFDTQIIEFEQAPDFSTPGKKEFNVLIKSNYFGTIKTIPVTINVAIPTVKMQILQVYKENTSKPIFKELETETTVSNDVNFFNVQKGIPITTILKNIFDDSNNNLNLNYDWYNKVDYQDYVVYLDGESTPTVTNNVPEKNFKLYINYTGKIDIDVSNIEYSNIKLASANNTKHLNPKTDQVLTITNTTLTNDWYLSVSLPDGIKKISAEKEDFLGGLYTKKGEQIPTNGSSILFSNHFGTQKLIKEVPLDIELHQNLGNTLGSYSGSILWTLSDVP